MRSREDYAAIPASRPRRTTSLSLLLCAAAAAALIAVHTYTLDRGDRREAPHSSSAAFTSSSSSVREGFFKSTWAVSSPLTTSLPFLESYFPVFDNSDSCTDDRCTCGTQGRVSLTTGIGSDFSFAVHTVNAAGKNDSRFGSTGRLSLPEIERWVGKSVGDLSSFSPLMDSATCFWSKSLESFIRSFDADAVSYLPLTWTTESAQTFYSLIVHIPQTMVRKPTGKPSAALV